MGRNGIFEEADSEKKIFQRLISQPGRCQEHLNAFLVPYTCIKQEPSFSKPLLPWKNFPPAVLVFLVGGQGQSSILSIFQPFSLGPMSQRRFGQQPKARPLLSQALTIQIWTLLAFYSWAPESSSPSLALQATGY